nr:MAG TPA: head to tail adaptor [Caudoviricetes sp.]
MFIETEELRTAIKDYTLGQITTDEVVIRSAILMAIQEATSYLNGRYDTIAIFNATGDKRNMLVLEHCKSMAVWYIIRLSNADILFDKAKIYYQNAIEWFKQVAGVGESGKSIAPDLPLKQEDGKVKLKMRFGSNRKFRHFYND